MVSKKFKQFIASKRKFNPPSRKPKIKRVVAQDPFPEISREVRDFETRTVFPALDREVLNTALSAGENLIGLQNEADAIDKATEDAIPDEV